MAEGTWRSQGPPGPPGVTRQASDRRVEPPLVIQNAMLTKDKKPFTYTPGGIDLSEIRSPRMARRIERNANAPGVGDIPRISPPRGPTEPLPPSALAAMQPALPVKVLPAGAPPPPPPPPMNIPPPPPMEALPTKTVTTNEGIFERPDMTKIIPENPMALLRKTGGVNRRSFVEEPAYSDVQPQVNSQQNYVTPQFYMPESQTRQPVQAQQPVPPQFRQAPQPQIQAQPQYMQPKPQMAAVPRQNSYQEQPQEMKTSTAQLGQLYIPPLNNDNQKNIISPPLKVNAPSPIVTTPPSPPQRGPSSPAQSPGSPQSPMATLNRAPRPWQNQKPVTPEVPAWAQRSHTSPPTSSEEEAEEPMIVQTSPQVNYQKRIVPQSPGVQQNVFNQQSPQRVPQSPGLQQQQSFNQQQRMPQQQPNFQPNVVGRVIIPVQMDASPTSPNVEAVYVTQPIVLQHPGPRADVNQQKMREQQLQQQQLQQQQLQQQQLQQQQLQQQQLQQQQLQQQQLQQQQLQQQQYQEQQRQQQIQQQRQQQYQQQQSQKTDSKSIRIIPIQIEGSTNNNFQGVESNTPNSASVGSATPGSARTFNRQPSWSPSGPIQSNSFKVLQRITNTDGEEDENEETTEHGPRRSQQFDQPPAEQIRKLKLNENDQELMNKLKQGVDEENFLHKEVDPRYRGAAIPSKAFRFLQSMTDSSNQAAIPSVPRSNQVGNQGQNIRTIPVQIEAEATGKPYVPPSEQTVPEPKKYTGGKIPSRSFKVLQAMTGETCGPDQSDL